MARNKVINAAIAAAFSLIVTSGSANATSSSSMMEKCMITGANGKSLIKEGKADCKTSMNSCAGHNKAENLENWIALPEGTCDKIAGGKRVIK